MTDVELIQSVTALQDKLVVALGEMKTLISEMTEVSRPTFTTDEEEKEKVYKFVFNLQKTGMTNMLNTDEYIQKRFGFTKAKSQTYLFDYIDNYTELSAKYSNKPVVEEPVIVKKRKGPKPYSEMTPDELIQAKAKKAGLINPVNEVLNTVKRTIKLKKTPSDTPLKSNAMFVWNAFMETVKAEMETGGEEVKYDDVRKKALEMKEADPASYKLFSDNWSPES